LKVQQSFYTVVSKG